MVELASNCSSLVCLFLVGPEVWHVFRMVQQGRLADARARLRYRVDCANDGEEIVT